MDLVQVYQDTFEKTRKYKRTIKSEKFAGILTHFTPKKPFGLTQLLVFNEDCIELCLNVKRENPTSRVCCLNMASDFIPGGGVRKGSRAQEEHICRCSALLQSLNSHCKEKPYLKHDEFIYSHDVPIIKDGNYQLLDEPVFVDFISIAAIRRPQLKRDGTYYPRDRKLMENKITQILQTAAYYNVDTLILGAFGCGAFYNPPEEVATIFSEILYDYEGCFGGVYFAIKDETNELTKTFDNLIDCHSSHS